MRKLKSALLVLLTVVMLSIFSLSIFSIAKMQTNMKGTMPCPISKMAGSNDCFFMKSIGLQAILEHISTVSGNLLAVVVIFSLVLPVLFSYELISRVFFICHLLLSYYLRNLPCFTIIPRYILNWLIKLEITPETFFLKRAFCYN